MGTLNQTISVDDFGAVGDWDGATGTDDTAAINSAIDAAGGGTVLFGPKRYRIVGGVTGGASGTRLVGRGRKLTELHNDGTAGTALVTTPTSIRGYAVESMFLSSKSGSGQGACLLISENFGEIVVSDVEINAYGSAAGIQAVAGNGIHLYLEQVRVNGGAKCFDFFNAGSTAINTIVANACYANDADQYGWDISNVTQAMLTGCSGDNSGARTSPGYGFRLSGVHTKLTGCTAEHNGNYTSLTGGGYVVSGGVSTIFESCSTYNQGQPWTINAANGHILFTECHTSTPIPFGSAMSLNAYSSLAINGGGPLIIGAVANAAFTTRLGGLMVDGTLIADSATRGVVMRSANGHYWRVTISDAGALAYEDLGGTRPTA